MKKRHLVQANQTEVAIMQSLGNIQAALDHCTMTVAGQDKAGSTPWAAALALYYTAKHEAFKLQKISKVKRFPHRPRHLACFRINRTFQRALQNLGVQDELVPWLEAEVPIDSGAEDPEFARAWTPDNTPPEDPLKGRTDTVKFSALVTSYLKCMMYSLNPVEEMIEDGSRVRTEMVQGFVEHWG